MSKEKIKTPYLKRSIKSKGAMKLNFGLEQFINSINTFSITATSIGSGNYED